MPMHVIKYVLKWLWGKIKDRNTKRKNILDEQ